MFGTKLKHKIFSSVLFLFAAIVFIGIALSVSEHRAVSFGNVSSFGAALVLLSFALIPEFVFSNKLRKQTEGSPQIAPPYYPHSIRSSGVQHH